MIPIPPNYATLARPETEEIKISKVGFSFTALLFSFVPAIFRGDWYNFFCIILVDAAVGMMGAILLHQPIAVVYQTSEPLMQIVWGFLYNMMYCRHLTKIGFIPTDQRSADLLRKSKYMA